jgi:hypothetical protein
MLVVGWRKEAGMKNLFEAATAKEVRERIGRLCPTSQRKWGKMTAPQAMAHCSVGMEWAVGDRIEPRMFLGRIIGPLVKSQLLKDEKRMGRNAPTAKSLVVNATWGRNARGCPHWSSGFALEGRRDAPSIPILSLDK